MTAVIFHFFNDQGNCETRKKSTNAFESPHLEFFKAWKNSSMLFWGLRFLLLRYCGFGIPEPLEIVCNWVWVLF